MPQLAKLFMNGRSQAVRLPAEFRFDSDAVFISRDESTGNVILSGRPKDWDGFFAAVDDLDPSDKEGFLQDRDMEPAPDRGLFDD